MFAGTRAGHPACVAC